MKGFPGIVRTSHVLFNTQQLNPYRFPFPFLAFFSLFISLSPIPHSPSAFPLFQFLFTLLSKFFSSFARATFLLSVSRPSLAFRVCYPVIFTLDSQRTRLYLLQSTFHRLFPTPTGLSPFLAGLSQSNWRSSFKSTVSSTKDSLNGTSVMRLPHPTFSPWASVRFTRSYYGHHSCFLFLGLMICLNSPGNLKKQLWCP